MSFQKILICMQDVRQRGYDTFVTWWQKIFRTHDLWNSFFFASSTKKCFYVHTRILIILNGFGEGKGRKI